MSRTKWYAKPIYVMVALALVLSLGIMAVPMAGTVEANGTPPTFTFYGGSLTADLGPWGGIGYVYPLTFDVTASPLDITFYDVDSSLLKNDNGTTPWDEALKGVGMPGLTAGTSITSIDPTNNSVFWTMVNLNSSTDHDWNGNPVSTLGPDGTCFTSDDTRHWGFQDWYRPATGGKIPGAGEDPYYNPESYVTPNDRFTNATAYDASFYNTFDLRIKITHTGDNNYNYEMWVRMHNCASVVEGCTWCNCGVWNHAINNCGEGDAWRQLASGGNTVFPISDIDLIAVHPFVGLGNYPVPATHTLTWGDVVVTGTPTPQAEVWVDNDWTCQEDVDLFNPDLTWQYDAFATIQDGIDAVEGSTVNVAAGTYTEYLHITTDGLTIEGAGVDQSIIDLDGLTPYWHYDTCSSSYASRAGVLISGYGSPDEIVEGVTFKGFTVKNAGLNPPIPYPEFINNGNDQDSVRGIVVANGKNILIQNCKVQNSGYNGIGVGKARCTTLKQSEDVTIDHCISSDNWETGISVGDYVGAITITNNICSNNERPHPTDPNREYSGKGIEVSGKDASHPISGLISDNTCSNNGFEGIVLKNYADGVIIEDNTVTGHNIDDDGAGIFFYGKSSTPANCKNNIIRNNTVTRNIRGIVAYYAQACTIEGNTITTDSGDFDLGQAAIKIDGGNNITVKNNTISCDGAGIKVQKTWDGVDCYNNTFTGNTITGAKFAGVFISHGAHDNDFEYNTITGTTTLTRWAGEDYEETQGDGVFLWGYSGKEAGTGNMFHWNNIYDNADDGMENQVSTMTVNAENNWWGAKDGPSGVGPGSGDAVSANVDYDPWLGAEPTEVKSETISGSGTMTDTAIGGQVTINGEGDHTVTTAKYANNPGGACPFINEGSYYDVHLDSADGVNSLTVQFCPALEGENISYWDGISWVAASNQIYADGCIVVSITDDTQPSLADLTGTPFGQGFMPPVGGDAYPVNHVSLMLPWIAIAVPIIAGIAIFIRRRRVHS